MFILYCYHAFLCSYHQSMTITTKAVYTVDCYDCPAPSSNGVQAADFQYEEPPCHPGGVTQAWLIRGPLTMASVIEKLSENCFYLVGAA